MALVDYSSSSDESPPPATLKRKRSSPARDLPPLPSSFHDLYATAARTSTQDDPSLHGGRKRAVPHVEGNWPSHVYLEWLPSGAEHAILENLLTAVECKEVSRLNTLLTSSLSTPLPLHISLSAPLAVASDDKDKFLESLRKGVPAVGEFSVGLTELHAVSNELGTRWFLVLGVERPPEDELNRLLRWSNTICADHGLDELYVDKKRDRKKRRPSRGRAQEESRSTDGEYEDWSDKFHFSVGWALTSPELLLQDEKLQKTLEEARKMRVSFDSVKVKIGNIVTSLNLGEARKVEKGILG